MGYLEVGIIGAVIGGVIGGVITWVKPAKMCPQCGSALPKLQFISIAKRKRAGILKGGAICKQCGCVVDLKGNIVKPRTE